MPPTPNQAPRPALAACAALIMLAAPPAGAEAPVARAPFELGPRGHVLLEVSVNGGEPATFAVDTGAATHVIGARYDRASGMTLPREGGATVAGAHGGSDAVMTRVARLELGGIEALDQPAVIMDLSHVEAPGANLDGIVGAPLLAAYDVVLDFAAYSLELYRPGALAGSADGAGRGTRIELAAGSSGHPQGSPLVIFEVRYGDVPLRAVLDTGAGRSAINPAAAAALGLELPATAAPIPGPRHGQPLAALPGMEITLGAAALTSDAPVAIVDLPAFESLGLGDRPAMLIGTDFLVGRRIGLGYAERALYVYD